MKLVLFLISFIGISSFQSQLLAMHVYHHLGKVRAPIRSEVCDRIEKASLEWLNEQTAGQALKDLAEWAIKKEIEDDFSLREIAMNKLEKCRLDLLICGGLQNAKQNIENVNALVRNCLIFVRDNNRDVKSKITDELLERCVGNVGF